MNILDRLYIKIGYRLIGTNIPINIIIGLYLVSKKHIYTDVKTINYKKVFKLLKTFDRVAITGTGVLIVFYENFIAKYPLGSHSQNALRNEFANYKKLKDSNLSNLVDYSLVEKENYYVMDKLNRCDYPINACMSICTLFKKKAQCTLQLIKLLEQKIFKDALSYIKNKDELNRVVKILQSMNDIKSSTMHGDLTQYNIMLTSSNKVVLIDLDRFNFNGIEKIDRIHFIIEFFAKKRKKDFFEILETLLITKNISKKYFDYLFLYFVYRIGVEYDEEIQLPSTYFDNVNKLVTIFLERENLCIS